MSDPKVEIGIWAGIPLVLLIAYSVAFDNSAEIGKQNRALDGMSKKYAEFYLDQEATIPFEDALSRNNQQLASQEREFELIVERAMPGLTPVYKTNNYTKASAQATADLAAIRKLAERTGVQLPNNLPNDEALDTDPVKFTRQLAELYLFRNAMDMLIRDASSGTLKITGVDINNKSGFTDESGAIAVFLLDISAQIDFRSLERTLRNFSNNKIGLAIRMFDIEVPDRKRVNTEVPYMKVNLTISLCVEHDERWQLKPLNNAAAVDANSGQGRTRGSRF